MKTVPILSLFWFASSDKSLHETCAVWIGVMVRGDLSMNRVNDMKSDNFALLSAQQISHTNGLTDFISGIQLLVTHINSRIESGLPVETQHQELQDAFSTLHRYAYRSKALALRYKRLSQITGKRSEDEPEKAELTKEERELCLQFANALLQSADMANYVR